MKVKILLRDIRMERGITIERLAKLTGISTSHLSYIERGEKEPSLSIIIRLALALKVDEKTLYKVIR